MMEKSRMRDTFFSLRSTTKPERPTSSQPSVHTEFMGTDWEMDDDEIVSEFEDGENSPRVSINSSGQPSITTLSSYDEVQTPRSTSRFPGGAFPFPAELQPVEGPKGPHLFRSSMSTAHSIEYQHALSLSPITPKVEKQAAYQFAPAIHLTPLPRKKTPAGPFRFTDEELDSKTLADWTPEKVAQWMLNAGIEITSAERFVENDITGAILITLRFEDLKELGIPSFGVRTKIWEEVHLMRNGRRAEVQPDTPIDDEPARAVQQERQQQEEVANMPKRRPSKNKPRPKINDVISPLESVSIVGIEQMMPKPHNCSKGRNCAKWKRNQRMIDAFKKDHPFINVEEGTIMVAGDPGNPGTADAIKTDDDFFRPVSDAIPSVVASSDVMGPDNLPPLQYLQEALLAGVQSRDPQDNVRQFLQFQHQHLATSSEVPPTPPFEIFPASSHAPAPPAPAAPHQGLRGLPKLAIPTNAPAISQRQPASAHPIPYRETADASPAQDEVTPTAPYRFGTPFSDMDVPVTNVNLGPVARDASQSVPPDMNYRPQIVRTASRATARRPSFPVLPSLDENAIVIPKAQQSPKSFAQRLNNSRPLQAPPRVQYPWTQGGRGIQETAIAPFSGATGVIHPGRASPPSDKTSDMTDGSAIGYQGLMKKRKTKMLRHEWHEHYFTLRGTRLTMHKDAASANKKTLEYIDIDDYAIACSGAASTNKLNAAFKAMHIRRDSGDKNDVAAFSFQLIPQDQKGGVRLRKRESALPGIVSSALGVSSSSSGTPGPQGAANGTGKTHHFAVRSRDERIDWMRELMLAKALKQKGEGFEVSVNGNM
ncbi:hypothetical protein GQ53DRAFT_747184, partial [Thozetella sp. PMI_491]